MSRFFRRELTPGDIGKRGHCEMCAEFSMELVHIVAYGYDTFVCPKCQLRIQERIRRRYLIAGEHTEPAE